MAKIRLAVMFFRDYFSTCRFLVPSRKNVRSGFFLPFFYAGVCARARAWLVTENAWEFSAGPTAPTREENEKSHYFFPVYRDAENAPTSPPSRSIIIGLLYASRCDNKMPAGHDLSRSDVTIYEPLRAKARWNYRDVPWWMRLSLDVATEPVLK